MAKLSRVSVIILNWNGANATISCAESVLRAFMTARALLESSELLIVDNGSDQDIELLKEWCHASHSAHTMLLSNPRNLGFAGGMNTGIRRALEGKSDFVWLLNNDLLVGSASILNLTKFSQLNKTAAIIGSTIVDPISGHVRTAGGYKYYSWLGINLPIFAGKTRSELLLTQTPKLDYVDGAAIWLRGDFIARVRQLPEVHFLYFEELELNQCLQGEEEIAWCREAEVFHQGGGSSSTAYLQERATYHSARSAFRYTQRHYPWRLPTVIFARLVGITMRALLRCQPGLILATAKALRDFHRQM
jgi:GT2 family glycosyltransferase